MYVTTKRNFVLLSDLDCGFRNLIIFEVHVAGQNIGKFQWECAGKIFQTIFGTHGKVIEN